MENMNETTHARFPRSLFFFSRALPNVHASGKVFGWIRLVMSEQILRKGEGGGTGKKRDMSNLSAG